MRIYKCDAYGREVLHYDGELLSSGADFVCVRAVFRATADLGIVQFEHGDIFTEWFYSNRWYNIFRVERGTDGQLRGWYCNITRPATLTAHEVHADDLALDVFVTPTGELHLLDADEFGALELNTAEQAAAWGAVQQIEMLVRQRHAPFEDISSPSLEDV